MSSFFSSHPRSAQALLRKIRAVSGVYAAECFAYPAVSVIWILADAIAAILLPAVWIAAAGPGGRIAGFSGREMATYYLVTLTLSQFITSHLMWDIAWDIREGHFSAQIVRPFSFLLHCVARNLAWRVTKLLLFLPIGVAFYLCYLGLGPPASLHLSGTFVAALVLGHALSFLSAYCLALLTLWTVESFSVMELYYVPEQVLSGRLVPLSTLPAWALAGGSLLPFRYTVAFPAELLLGRMPASDVARAFAFQAAWIVVMLLLARTMLRAGMKRYTGSGM